MGELDRRAREVISGTAELEGWAKGRNRIEAHLRQNRDLTHLH
jgi:hypothetical protein